MPTARSFKRPNVEDPVLAKAFQQIDDEFTKLYRGLSSIGSASAFLGLTDTPAAYTDQGEKLVAVKATEDGLEFVEAPAGGGDMTKAVYDDDDDGSVEQADDADTVDGQHAAAFEPAGEAAAERADHESDFNHALLHSSANDPSADEKAALAGTNGTPSAANKFVTNSDPRMSVVSSQWSVAKITAGDTVHSTYATFVNVPGLAFSLVSGHRYYIKFLMQVQTATASRGPRWQFSGPAMTFEHYSVHGSQGAIGTAGYYHGDKSSLSAIINGPQQHASTGTSYWCEIEVMCQPSENGTLQLMFSTEAEGVDYTVKDGGLAILCDLG